MKLCSIGSDFEMGLLHHGVPVSVEGLIGGSKHDPLWIRDDLGNMQEDNVLAEAAVVPCYNKEEFTSKMSTLRTYLFDWAEGKQLKIATQCSIEYAADQLRSHQAMEFGCDTDYNAWTSEANPRPRPNGGRRSAGGHVHVGVEADVDSLFAISRAMDAFITVPLMLVQDKVERGLEIERRALYGKAGATRIKPYGLEYRTLSNQWTFKDELISFVYDATERAVQFVANGYSDMLDEQLIVPVVNRGHRPDLGYYYNLPEWEEI